MTDELLQPPTSARPKQLTLNKYLSEQLFFLFVYSRINLMSITVLSELNRILHSVKLCRCRFPRPVII